MYLYETNPSLFGQDYMFARYALLFF